jgi:uncharacterized protein YqcC (DUF446 family)
MKLKGILLKLGVVISSVISGMAIAAADPSTTKYEQLSKKLDEIQREMTALKLDKLPKPTEGQLNFQQAFAMDTMAYEQWLWFIFIPRVRDMIKNKEEVPKKSQVGSQAVREFDGRTDREKLESLLIEFDSLCNKT